MTATHLLIHRYVPGAGPQPGTPEHDDEMRRWGELDARLRNEGVIAGSFALQSRGEVITESAASPWREDGEVVFAAHAITAADDAAATAIARDMPTAEYGTVEVRPLMDVG
ncbi:YciI family protein [uncultured Agrococcus sp.]|uniref:YciI family protein n=1 Tax=uncultured Agrococcus sp. TaxID=382258 RepID=UPI0025DE97E7|nr:YciI family protein [uncultured Agrococcus sp.]